MDLLDTSGRGTPRSGVEHRVNPDRYFHVMGQGWYALTREGLSGPFTEKAQAVNYVNKLIVGAIRPEGQ